METLHQIFQLDKDTEIQWATHEPDWVEGHQGNGIEGLWREIRPEWLCTIMGMQSGGPFFTHFCRESPLNILYPHGATKNSENLHAIASAIANLRCLQYSGRLFGHNMQGRRLHHLNAATIAAYKASSELRASFPLLEQYLTRSLPKGGYIYLLSDQLGHYKIGHTIDVNRRLAELRTQPPFEITTAAYCYVPDRFRAEKELHQNYSKYRLRGEWFSLPSDAVGNLQRGLEYIEATTLAEVKAYADFNPREWQMIDQRYRNWTSPDQPSIWEKRLQESEESTDE